VSRGGGIAAGAVMFLIGALVIFRTVSKDDQGQNLVDRILSMGSPGANPVVLPSNAVSPADINPKQAGAIQDLLKHGTLPPSLSRPKHKSPARNRAAMASPSYGAVP
jgi:hypothetical protein